MLIMNSGNWSSHRLSRLETEANNQKIRARLYPGHIKYTKLNYQVKTSYKFPIPRTVTGI